VLMMLRYECLVASRSIRHATFSLRKRWNVLS
jgi:hypothetical protein